MPQGLEFASTAKISTTPIGFLRNLDSQTLLQWHGHALMLNSLHQGM